LAGLVKAIDGKVVRYNTGLNTNKLGAYINFLGSDFGKLKSATLEFGRRHKIARVPLVVPLAHENGPARIRIHSEAVVTVLIYQHYPKQVILANHTFRSGEIDAQAVATVSRDIDRLIVQRQKDIEARKLRFKK
jgi:hypothetical protein